MSFSKNKLKLIECFFIQYIRYLKVDLANSIVNDSPYYRNIHILISCRDIFGFLFAPDEIFTLYEKDTEKAIDELKDSIDIYQYKGKNLKIDESKFSINDDITNDILIQSNLLKLISNFFYANNMFREYFNADYIEKKF